MRDGNICNGQRPPGSSQHLIRFYAWNLSWAQNIILHASTFSLLPEMSNFLFSARLTYVSTSNAIRATKRSASTSHPTKRQFNWSSEHAYAVRNLHENKLAMSPLRFDNLIARSFIQLTLSSSGRAKRLFILPILSFHREVHFLEAAESENLIHLISPPWVPHGDHTVPSGRWHEIELSHMMSFPSESGRATGKR